MDINDGAKAASKEASDVSFTDEQLLAINTRDRTLIVSAAAGSGKTFTLTERIIRSILDTDNPKDLSKMLIVTFTNAAVADLRKKITAAIRAEARRQAELGATDIEASRLAAELEEQYLRVKDAKIVTINSFCNDILRQCAESVGLSPSYRIAEPAEAALIARDLLWGMINATLSDEMPEICSALDFEGLTEGLIPVRNEDELVEVFLYLYDKLSNEKLGLDTLRVLLDEYKLGEGGFSATEQFALIKEHLSEYITYVIARHEQYIVDLVREGDCDATVGTLTEDVDILRGILSCVSYGELYSRLQDTKFPNIKSCDSPLYDEIKRWRTKFKNKIFGKERSFKSRYFVNSEENIALLYPIIYKNGQIIYKFLKEFDKAFLADKKRRSIVEFRDAERYAYSALIDKSGNPTDLARSLAQRYTDIYIDEYQDVNALQGEIFEAISRPDNCFMVGDIKQSIYGFRSAKPDFFKKKKASFPRLTVNSPYTAEASLFMSKNFRCDKPIIDYVNSVFDVMFSELGESIAYVAGDRLSFAKKYKSEKGECPIGHIPELHLIQTRRDDTDAKEGEESDADSIEREEREASEMMAELVADKIAYLVNKKNGQRLANQKIIAPGDIAILLRTKTHAALYSDALAKHGIEFEIKDKTNFFKNKEVLLTFALLNAINNPRWDVYLSAIMASPLFSFTFDELAEIKAVDKDATLYDALLEYNSRHPGFDKGARLVEKLSEYRELSRGMSVDAFISLLYRETGLLAIAGASGRDNLLLLHGYARDFESSSFHGLYSFISYVNTLLEDNEAFKSSDEGEAEERTRVTIVTSHKSKGLEYPVVFMPEANRLLEHRSSGAQTHVALSGDFGIAFGIKDESGIATLKDSSEEIVRLHIKQREYEEELRVLYVALTRARERLYVYGAVGNIDEKLKSIAADARLKSKYVLKNLASALDILLFCREYGDGAKEKVTLVPHIAEPGKTQTANASEDTAQKGAHTVNNDVVNTLKSRFDYVYHSEGRLGIPEKLSVSVLTPTVLDMSDEGGTGGNAPDEIPDLNKSGGDNAQSEGEEKPAPIPKFMGGKDEKEAAARGTATHVFMQFFDPGRLSCTSVGEELRQLVERGFISEEDSDRVNTYEVTRFTRSQLFADMLGARNLFRELRFNVMLPARNFISPDNGERIQAVGDERILVQGVIDCIIEDTDGELHVIDYKTDRIPKDKDGKPVPFPEDALLERHKNQLTYYRDAVKNMFGKEPKTVGIFSLALGKTIYLNND